MLVLSSSLYINDSLSDLKDTFFTNLYQILDNPKRQNTTWIFSIVICIFYYYYKVYKNTNNENSKFIIKTSSDIIDCISSFCTYSAVINSSLNLISNISKEFVQDAVCLPKSESIDYFTLLGCAFLPFLWASLALINLVIATFSPQITITKSFVSLENNDKTVTNP